MKDKMLIALMGVLGVAFLTGCSSSPSATDATDKPAPVAVGSSPNGNTGSSTEPSRTRPPTYMAGEWYVNVLETPIRLGPSATAKATGAGYRGDALKVYELADGWGRISDYYDGAVEDVPGQRVARWIEFSQLVRIKPAPLPQPKSAAAIKADPRIEGLPEVGKYGLTRKDVEILHVAARYYLETGRATRIHWGDKSSTRPGYYFVSFDGESNHFFLPSDIPDLDRRIAGLADSDKPSKPTQQPGWSVKTSTVPTPSNKPPAAPSWTPTSSDKDSALLMANEFVKKTLKAPSTAKFPTMWDAQGVRVMPLASKDHYMVEAYVDAQNSFGARLRKTYTAQVRQHADRSWSCVSLKVND